MKIKSLNLNQMIEAGYTLETIMNHVRKIVLDAALEKAGGHIGLAAYNLGIHRNTFTRRTAKREPLTIRYERDPPLSDKEMQA